MGNILRRSSAVHPASGDGGRHVVVVGERKSRLRIKVRMRRDKLEELVKMTSSGRDESDGGGGDKIGFLILKECLESGLPVSVLSSGDAVWSRRCGNQLENRRLDIIKE